MLWDVLEEGVEKKTEKKPWARQSPCSVCSRFHTEICVIQYFFLLDTLEVIT